MTVNRTTRRHAELAFTLTILWGAAAAGCSPCQPKAPQTTLAEHMAPRVCRATTDESAYAFGEIRIDGCGLVSMHLEGGYTGNGNYFDSASGKRVGSKAFSDIPEEAFCDKHSYEQGQTPARDQQTCPERAVYGCTGHALGRDDTVAGPREGCRAPSETGCASCCRRSESLGAIACQRMTDDGRGSYQPESEPSRRDACTDCAPCADCTLLDEQRIATRPAGCVCVDEPSEDTREALSDVCRRFCDDTVGERSACRDASAS